MMTYQEWYNLQPGALIKDAYNSFVVWGWETTTTTKNTNLLVIPLSCGKRLPARTRPPFTSIIYIWHSYYEPWNDTTRIA